MNVKACFMMVDYLKFRLSSEGLVNDVCPIQDLQSKLNHFLRYFSQELTNDDKLALAEIQLNLDSMLMNQRYGWRKEWYYETD